MAYRYMTLFSEGVVSSEATKDFHVREIVGKASINGSASGIVQAARRRDRQRVPNIGAQYRTFQDFIDTTSSLIFAFWT